MKSIKLLALSGSLRKASYNTATLNTLKVLAPSHVEIVIGDIGGLPLFNPDREGEVIPAFEQLRESVKQSHGLVISSPEYAHGISGVLKNALDWLVSGEEFVYMPIMLINTSPRASHAQAALKEVLKTMSGNIIENSFTSISLLGSGLDFDSIVANQEIAASLQTGLNVFCAEIDALKLSKELQRTSI